MRPSYINYGSISWYNGIDRATERFKVHTFSRGDADHEASNLDS